MKKIISFYLVLIFIFSGCARISVSTRNETTATVYGYENAMSGTTTADAAGFTSAVTEMIAATATEQKTADTTAAPESKLNAGAKPQIQAPAVQPPATADTGVTVSTKKQNASIQAATPSTYPELHEDDTETAALSSAAEEPVNAAPATKKQNNVCVIRIECKTIKDNLKKLKAGKDAFVPANGIILDDTNVELKPDDTVFSVLQRACKENVCTDNCVYCRDAGIQLEFTFTPGFNTYYVEGIHQIYEKDCGTMSGWMFSLNGKFPEEGASGVLVQPGDRIVFCFTCDMGDDVGNHFEG